MVQTMAIIVTSITSIITAILTFGSCCCTAVQTLIFLVGGIIAWRQITVAIREQRLSAAWKIYEFVDAPDVRSARKYVFKNRKRYISVGSGIGGEFSKLSTCERDNAEKVCSSFDRIGYTASLGLLPDELVLKGMSSIVAKCWFVLKPFIEASRIQRKQPAYQRYFESLGKKAHFRYGKSDEELEQQLCSLDEDSYQTDPLHD
jgi:hypothetical protein